MFSYILSGRDDVVECVKNKRSYELRMMEKQKGGRKEACRKIKGAQDMWQRWKEHWRVRKDKSATAAASLVH